MSYQINDEALEAMYETVREQHQGLTDDECIILARELFWGDKVSEESGLDERCQSKQISMTYKRIEAAYKDLNDLVKAQQRLHPMDSDLTTFHLDDLEEIVEQLQQIVYYDPTP
jgi:chemotaxis protein histidine kinase CheA